MQVGESTSRSGTATFSSRSGTATFSSTSGTGARVAGRREQQKVGEGFVQQQLVGKDRARRRQQGQGAGQVESALGAAVGASGDGEEACGGGRGGVWGGGRRRGRRGRWRGGTLAASPVRVGGKLGTGVGIWGKNVKGWAIIYQWYLDRKYVEVWWHSLVGGFTSCGKPREVPSDGLQSL